MLYFQDLFENPESLRQFLVKKGIAEELAKKIKGNILLNHTQHIIKLF